MLEHHFYTRVSCLTNSASPIRRLSTPNCGRQPDFALRGTYEIVSNVRKMMKEQDFAAPFVYRRNEHQMKKVLTPTASLPLREFEKRAHQILS